MSEMTIAEWVAALTADDCERMVHAELGKGNIPGVEAALRILITKDPHRAERLMDLMRMGLIVAEARTSGGDS